MSRPPSVLQTRFLHLVQLVEARLPERARWITRLPGWAWGCAALAVIVLAGRLVGLSAGPEAHSLNAVPDTTLLAFDAIAKLGIVLGLFFVGVYALRRWRKYLPNQHDRKITLVETTRLSPRQALHLVRVGEQLLLIGATDQGLSLLTEVEEPPAAQPVELPLDFYSELCLRQAAPLQGIPESVFNFTASMEPEIR